MNAAQGAVTQKEDLRPKNENHYDLTASLILFFSAASSSSLSAAIGQRKEASLFVTGVHRDLLKLEFLIY